MKKILVLHGPNLNLLGTREPEIYGEMTLSEINEVLKNHAEKNHVHIAFFQSNQEGILVDRIQQARQDKFDYLLINPAAYTHTSIAIRDALIAINIPFIEIHLSNIYKRESFRQHSYLSDIAQGVMSGFGWQSYLFALEFALTQLSQLDLKTLHDQKLFMYS